ncbi:MAG: histidine phosphatase family protein [Deltaproteobacteria bacterium]|nr:histidine phosphatase family protein [Deltaproteobacteria bacterium]
MLIIARHGRTKSNASGLLLGRADPPLDELGEHQAAALAAALGTVDRVVSSPLARTRQTAAAFGVDAEIDDRFVELDYGEWDERPVADVPAAVWQQWRSDLDFAPPGGESIRSLGERVRAGLDELAADAVDQTIVVVSHVSPIKAALAWTLGVGDEVAWRSFVQPAAVMRIGVSRRSLSLHAFNDTSHLVDLG